MLNSADARKTPERQGDVVELLAPELHHFSLVREGPLYRLARVIVLDSGPGAPRSTRRDHRTDRLGAVGRAERVADRPVHRSDGDLLRKPGHARAIPSRDPAIFVAETWFDARTGEVLRDLVRARVVPVADVPGFVSMLRRAIALVDSWLVEAALVIVTMALLISGIRVDLPTTVSTWRNISGVPGR